MKRFLSLVFFCYSYTLFSQELDILIKETPPYYEVQEINIEIYLTNNTDDSITYFDSQGYSWGSFKEVWDLNENSRFVEILSLNSDHDGKFTDSTIITLKSGEQRLIRTHSIFLEASGDYSLTYTQHQSSEYVNKKLADNTVTDSAIQSITTFSVSKNIKFDVFKKYDTTITKVIDMTWDEWKDYNHVKVHSRHKHFDNLYAAFRYPQDAYALTLFCNGYSQEDIIKIGTLKNLKSLKLINYNLNYFPQELAALNLYELTIIPKDTTHISFNYGLSKDTILRKLTGKFYGSFPVHILALKELIYLDISDSYLSVFPDLSSLQNLEVLIANNNNVSTLNGVGLNELPKLKELNLSGNKKLDKFGEVLNCTNLEFLTINRNKITAIPDSIENLTKLKRLSISNSLVNISDSIGKLSDMRYLNFGGNTKLTYLPATIVNMKKLVHLSIIRTQIKQLPEGISELPLKEVMIKNQDFEINRDYKLLKKRLKQGFKE